MQCPSLSLHVPGIKSLQRRIRSQSTPTSVCSDIILVGNQCMNISFPLVLLGCASSYFYAADSAEGQANI